MHLHAVMLLLLLSVVGISQCHAVFVFAVLHNLHFKHTQLVDIFVICQVKLFSQDVAAALISK